MKKEKTKKDTGKATVGTTVPKTLVRALDQIVENSNGLYKDRADFIRDALRDKITSTQEWLNQKEG